VDSWRVFEVPSRRVSRGGSFIGKASRTNSFRSVMDRWRLTILQPCVIYEVNRRFRSRVCVSPVGLTRVTTLFAPGAHPIRALTSTDAIRRMDPQTAAIIIAHHSSRPAAYPLLIVHSAGVGRAGSGAGGARSGGKLGAGALIWPAR
jgi:hypothetical protein